MHWKFNVSALQSLNAIFAFLNRNGSTFENYRLPKLDLADYIPHFPIYAGFRCAICPVYKRKYECILEHASIHHPFRAKYFVREWYFFSYCSILQMLKQSTYIGVKPPKYGEYYVIPHTQPKKNII